MDSFVYLIYTHEEYHDILDLHLKRIHKYWPSCHVSICSSNIAGLRDKYSYINIKNIYQYDDTKPYGERLRSVVEQMSETFVLLNHDHNIFVGEFPQGIIPMLLNSMIDRQLDQIRMMASGIGSPIFPEGPSLTENKGPYFLSCITTLWRRNTFLDIVTRFADHSFRCFECEPIQAYVSQFKNMYLSSSQDQQFIGEGHFLSYYFPVAHLTHAGKWRTSTPTNRYYIEQLQNEYDVDLEKRGRI